MLTNEDIQLMTAGADEVAGAAQDLRVDLRRRTHGNDPERVAALEAAIAELNSVMEPLRRALGQITWLRLEPGVEQRLREASESVQRERRKLRKMLSAKTRRSGWLPPKVTA